MDFTGVILGDRRPLLCEWPTIRSEVYNLASSEKSVGHRYAPMGAEPRLAQPANPMLDSAASAFPVRNQFLFELVALSGKRYAVREDLANAGPYRGT